MGSDLVVSLDGAVLDASTPLIRGDDLGVLRGDGVFETALITGGEVREWAAHLARMRRSSDRLELQLPAEPRWRAAVDTAMAAHGPADELVLRLICTRGPEAGGPPTAYVRLSPVPQEVRRQRRAGIAVVLLDRGVGGDVAAAPWLLLGAKNLSYAANMAAQREARRRGADDAIYLAPDGQVLEAPTSSVVVVGPGTALRTPPHDAGILPGTTQQALFREAGARGWSTGYARLTVEDLHDADAVWLVSSVRLVVAVRSVDGVDLVCRTGVDVAHELLGY